MRWFMLAVAVPLLAMNGGAGASVIIAVHSDKCLEASTGAGAQIFQTRCIKGRTQQQWMVQSAGGNKSKIVSAKNFMCMDVEGASVGDIVKVIQFPCTTGGNQKFTLDPRTGASGDARFRIRTFAEKCLDIDSGSFQNNAGLIQFACTDRSNQRFHIK